MTVCLLQLAESKTEESCLEEKSIRKTLSQESGSTEDIDFAIRTEDSDVAANEKKPTSFCDSFPRHCTEPFSVKDEFGETEKTRMPEVSPKDAAAVSLPENVILELLQASQVAAGGISEGNTSEEKSSGIDLDKFIVVIFTNQCTPLTLQEIEMMRGSIYLGSFSRSTLSDKELIFVPHSEVQPSVLLELFRHLPKAFPPYVITEFGESKVLCLKETDMICNFKKGQKGNSLAVRKLERSSSSFNLENINVFKAPVIYLTRCLELISVPSCSIQKSISKSSLTNTDEQVMNSRHLTLLECADALNTIVSLKEAAGAIPDANVGGQLAYENVGDSFLLEPGEKSNSLLPPPGNTESDFRISLGAEEGGQSAGIREDDASTSQRGAPVQKSLEQGSSIEGSPLPLDSGWSEEAREEPWCSAEANSSGDSKEDFALGILSELRSLSHSLLDVFDIIQRTPPLTKKVLTLPREVLSQHKVLHASTSSLESCPLAQSECFCGDEVGANRNAKKKRKRRKKCSM